jgi:hypothetical protein
VVTTLTLLYCNLATSFWSALDDAFPALNTLEVGLGSSCKRMDLANYCNKRAVTATAQSPFRLTLHSVLFKPDGGEEVQANLAAQGFPHISIVC